MRIWIYKYKTSTRIFKTLVLPGLRSVWRLSGLHHGDGILLDLFLQEAQLAFHLIAAAHLHQYM